MLSQVLLRHMARALIMIVAPAAVLMAILFGFHHAFGLLVGSALIGVSVGGLVFIVGRLLDPTEETSRKSLFTLALVVKMTSVAGVLWLCMARWGVSGLGILFGIGLGLFAIQVGLIRGSSSDEGKRAMDESEARIREELGDSDEESR